MVCTLDNFTTDNITFSNPIKGKIGGKNVYVRDSGRSFKMQLNVDMNDRSTAFVMKPYMENTQASNGKRTILLTGENGRAEWAEQWDSFLLQMALKHSEEWFGRKISEEVIKEYQTKILAPSKDQEKYPVASLKLKFDEYRTKVYLSDGSTGENGNLNLKIAEDFDIDSCGTRFNGVFIISGYVWIQNAKFGYSATIDQMIVFPENETTREEESFSFGVNVTSSKRDREDSDEDRNVKRIALGPEDTN